MHLLIVSYIDSLIPDATNFTHFRISLQVDSACEKDSACTRDSKTHLYGIR